MRSISKDWLPVYGSLQTVRERGLSEFRWLQRHRPLLASEPWTPFLDRLPLVPKCYHDPSGAGPEAKPAGIGAAAAAWGDFCSYA